MVHFDFWYGHSKKNVAFVSVSFSDCDCIYRGVMYDASKKMIGDFWSVDSVAIEKAFPGVFAHE